VTELEIIQNRELHVVKFMVFLVPEKKQRAQGFLACALCFTLFVETYQPVN
jgi:hypothetical protein